jgi:hypothetical protein
VSTVAGSPVVQRVNTAFALPRSRSFQQLDGAGLKLLRRRDLLLESWRSSKAEWGIMK